MRSWLGGEATERIEEWRTVVYEAAGVVKAVSVEKVRSHLPQVQHLCLSDRTFDCWQIYIQRFLVLIHMY